MPPNPRSAEGCAYGAVIWRSARCFALADSLMVMAVWPTYRIFESQVGAAAPTSQLSAALSGAATWHLD
jgi:hypothetical protein